MMSFGLFASSSSSTSSSSSSNLSPLALPFTVERSNPNNNNFNFNGKSDGVIFWSTSSNFQTSTTSQGLLSDSITTATVPSIYSTFSNPNPNTNPITIKAPRTHSGSSVSAVNLSVIGPNQRVTDALFSSTFNNTSSSHNWSSMNSSVKSGLEHVNLPAGNLFGVDRNTQPHKWSLGNDVGDNDGSMMHLDFNLDHSRSFVQDFGSKYSGQADGSRGKEDSSLFGPAFSRPATREENNIGPSIVGNSPSVTCHGVVSSGFSNEHTFTWDDYASRYPFETESVLYNTSSGHISPSMTSKSLDTSSTSVFTKHNVSVSYNALKEKESYEAVGFDYKSSLTSQVPDINSTEELNSAANLDHHNPGEDSPCWKGAPTHFSSSGSQEQESSQHPMKKLQNNSISGEDVLLHMDQNLDVNAVNAVTSESLDVNMVVKALNNLSELLLCQYSKDECELKEQDHKALDHVIANLNLCISRKIQQVNPMQKCSSSQQITSNVLHEAVHPSALHQERNNDQFVNNIEELQSSCVKDERLPKDYNMVQKIKRVLDEDLEFREDLPADPLLYKNLWLEAEAELCLSSYRTRIHRAKREIGKSKALDLSEVASDIKKISVSNFSPTASKLMNEAAGSKTSNMHAPSISLPIVDDNDDVENSVMARFNILKRRSESNPVNMAEKEPADVEASGNKIQTSGVFAEKPHLQHLLDTDGVVVMHSHGNQKMQNPLATEHVDHAVMGRLNILKSRGEVEPVKSQVSEEGSIMLNEFGSLAGYSASSLGWEYVVEGGPGYWEPKSI